MKNTFKQVIALLLASFLTLPLLASCGSEKAESEETVTEVDGIPVYDQYKGRKVDLGLSETEKVFDVMEFDGQLRVTVGVLDPNYDPEENNGYYFIGYPYPTEHRWYSLDYVEDTSKREKTTVHQEIALPSDPDSDFVFGGEAAEKAGDYGRIEHGVIYHVYRNGETQEHDGFRPFATFAWEDPATDPVGYDYIGQLMICDEVPFLSFISGLLDTERVMTINHDATYWAYLYINGREVDTHHWFPGDPYYTYMGLIGIGGEPYALLRIEDKARLVPLTAETTEIPLDGIDIEGNPTGGAFTDGFFGYFMSDSELWRTDGKESHCIAELAPQGVDRTSSVRSVRTLSDGRLLVSADGKLIELTESTGSDAIHVCDIGLLDYDEGSDTLNDFDSFVFRYNEQAEDFFIRVKEYKDVGKLNLAILSGNVDMVITPNQFVLGNYIKQELLVPLEEVAPALFEKDALIQSVVDAARIDGVCYYLPVNFDVCGEYIADPSLLEDGTPLEDRIAYYNYIKESDPVYFKSHTPFQIFDNFTNDLDEWIDWENYTCHFDDGTFIPLLEFCAMGCTEDELNDYNAARFNIPLAGWWGRDEKAGSFELEDAVESYRFTDVKSAQNYQKGLPAINGIAGPTTWVQVDFPMPSRVHEGYAIDAHNFYAIVDHEDTKEAAADFLSWLILEDVVEEFPKKHTEDYHARGWDGFSINKDETDRYLRRLIDDYVDPEDEVATIRPEVAAEFPSTVANIRYWAQKHDARCGQSQYEITWNYINKADHLRYADSELMRVIRNEAQGFFSGSITAEKAADYIQNRISLYLAEQS